LCAPPPAARKPSAEWNGFVSAGDRLERLRGNCEGQYSIRIHEQYRICFEWRESNAFRVEITDYH